MFALFFVFAESRNLDDDDIFDKKEEYQVESSYKRSRKFLAGAQLSGSLISAIIAEAIKPKEGFEDLLNQFNSHSSFFGNIGFEVKYYLVRSSVFAVRVGNNIGFGVHVAKPEIPDITTDELKKLWQGMSEKEITDANALSTIPGKLRIFDQPSADIGFCLSGNTEMFFSYAPILQYDESHGFLFYWLSGGIHFTHHFSYLSVDCGFNLAYKPLGVFNLFDCNFSISLLY